MSIVQQDVSLVILAGGKARRMGGQSKGLIPLAGKPLIQHELDRLAKDMDGIEVLISANDHQQEYKAFGYEVIGDVIDGQLGPLSGIYSAMLHSDRQWVLSLPCDIPLIPQDYISRMLDHNANNLAWVAEDKRQHPGCCLLHCSLKDELKACLNNNELAVHLFLEKHQANGIDFSDQAEAFENINTPEQLVEIEKHV